MFGFLKKKLKKVVDKFSKKVDEEAETKEEVVEVKEEVIEEPEKIVEKVEVKEEVKVVPEKIEVPKDKVHITYFVHGTTTDNEKGLCTGWNQGELSELGIKQAKELKDQIRDKKFDVVFCSDLKRAVDSAKFAFADVPIIQDKRIRECDYGDLTGKKEEDIDYAEYIYTPFPDGESLKDVEKRIAEFLNEIYDEFKGKRVAIISHKAPQLALDVLLKGKTWEKAIKEDWRLQKKWQPGWDYDIKEKIIVKEIPEKEVTAEELLEEIEKEEIVEKEIVKEEIKIEKPKVEEKIEVKEEIKEEKPEKKVEIKEEIKAEPKEERRPIIEPEKPKGFFKKIKQVLTTKKISEDKFDKLFWDLELILLENNTAIEVIEKIKNDLKKNIVEKPIPKGKIEELIVSSLKYSIEDLFYPNFNLVNHIKQSEKRPFVICFVGINGSGKTTTIAKMANLFQKNGLGVVLAAADTFRAAAIDQLQLHADKLKVKLIKHDYGSDPAAVAFDAVKHAQSTDKDVVLIDTAGRIHSNINLMEELSKIIRVAKPDLKIFVGESITGNDCTEQAKKFDDAVGIDGIILSKADVDDKGGAAISVSYVTKKPILYLGIGQEYDDLEFFKKESILQSIGF